MNTEDIITQYGATAVTTGDGRIIYTAHVEDTEEVFIAGEQLTRTEDNIIRVNYHSERGSIIALSDPGNEQLDIIEVDPETGEVTPLVEDEFLNLNPNPHPTDPDKFAYISIQQGVNEVFEMNIETGEVNQVTDSSGIMTQFDYSPDGTTVLYQTGLRNDISLHIASVDGDENDYTVADTENSEQTIGDPNLSMNPDVWGESGILFATNENGFLDIAVASEDGEYEFVFESETDKVPIQWISDDSFLYVEKQGGKTLLGVWRDGEPSQITSHGTVLSADWNNGTPVYVLSDYTSPGDVWIEDKIMFEHGEFDESVLIQPESVTYQSFDGLEIPAFIYESEDSKSDGRAVIFLHGGPEFRSKENFRWREQALAQKGFTVLVPNVRGSTGFGREYRKMTDQDLGGDDMKDVVAAAEYLRGNGYDSVGLYGHSYGGYLTLRTHTQSDAFDAAVSLCGPSSLKTILENTRGVTRVYLRKKIGGSYEEKPEFYEERSPINSVDDITDPVMIVQGGVDHAVEEDESSNIVDKLDEFGKDYEYILYEDEAHSVTGEENRVDLIKNMETFFNNSL